MNNRNNFEICPYDRRHIVGFHKFPLHLIKCRKAHPELILEICPHNARHHYPKEKMEEHILKCPNRMPFDSVSYAERLRRKQQVEIELKKEEEEQGAKNCEVKIPNFRPGSRWIRLMRVLEEWKSSREIDSKYSGNVTSDSGLYSNIDSEN
ncbi:hypothetical protein ACOME3_001663 [Neoechinorhynchus agilis]